MKLAYLLFFAFLFSCQNQNSEQQIVNENMIQHFLESDLAKEMKRQNNKVYIFKNDYCEAVGCEDYFKGFEKEVLFIRKEDAFMRGLDNWLVISKIDEQNGVIQAKKIQFRLRKK